MASSGVDVKVEREAFWRGVRPVQHVLTSRTGDGRARDATTVGS